MDDTNNFERYHRQLLLPGFGIAGQQRLQQARVLVVGAGGLGCPVLMALTGAGIGHIGIADDGLVELSNLHRQFLYQMTDIGSPKVFCAQHRLHALNPETEIQPYPFQMTTVNTLDIIAQYDIIIDGTDNFAARYMLNDACALLNKPLIYGAVSRFEGQVAVFGEGITYRDIFPHPPAAGEVDNCSQGGVLGVLPGIIGHWMANECIKMITETGKVLSGKLLTYSAPDNRMFIARISATAEGAAALPASRETFLNTNYPAICEAVVNDALIITPAAFLVLQLQQEVLIIDVREQQEEPALTGLKHLRIPLSVFAEQMPAPVDTAIVFICQSGRRSLKAARAWQEAYKNTAVTVCSVEGGINALRKLNPDIIK